MPALSSIRELRFSGQWDAWRVAARSALLAECAPHRVRWCEDSESQQSLFAREDAVGAEHHQGRRAASVPKEFLTIGADVACHGDSSRWDTLYRVLWRLTHGERHLLSVYVDPDVHRLHAMAKAVRREGHKLRAFVRFRRVQDDERAERFVAWFEPAHDVVAREAPFFARRFSSMCWSILTPSISAHWDGDRLSYAAGLTRAEAPAGDELEALWRTYYASIFNPARVKVRTMRAEMPVRYWKHLPEATLIAPLLREAPGRVRRMVEAHTPHSLDGLREVVEATARR